MADRSALVSGTDPALLEALTERLGADGIAVLTEPGRSSLDVKATIWSTV